MILSPTLLLADWQVIFFIFDLIFDIHGPESMDLSVVF